MDWGLHGMPQQVDERLRDYYSRRRGLREWRPVGGAITKPAAVPGRPMRNAGNQTLISTNHKDSTLKLKNSKSKLIRNGFNLKVKNAQPNRLNGGSDVTPSPSKNFLARETSRKLAAQKLDENFYKNLNK